VRDVPTPRQPLKVVVDRHAELAPTARLLAEGETLVFSGVPPATSWPPHVQFRVLPDRDRRIDLGAMLDVLGTRGINEVHVEAGAKLNGALLAAGLGDELVIYLAPCLLGDPARGMFDWSNPIATLADRVRLQIQSVVAIGEDWRVVARTVPGRS
jgi:diaminohydroxyphosphoribosylaminopyrimidine deaminase/5-amino-6-(5-phosphoribosylamino)uracil reductase